MADERRNGGGTDGSREARGFRLRITGGDPSGPDPREMVFGARSIRLGRAQDCDVVLQDAAVSRHHADLRRTATGYVLVDLESANGTWIGEERISEHALGQGETFRLGGVSIEFYEILTPAEDASLPDAEAVTEPEPPEVPPEGPPPEEADTPGDQEESEEEETPEPEPVREYLPIDRLPDELDDVLELEGERVEAGGNNPFLLSGSDNVWFVETGKVEVFTVPLEGKTYKGPRSHFVSVKPGQCMFGMDLFRLGMGSGFLAVGAMQTVLRKVSVKRLQELAGKESLRTEIAERVDTWVAGLSRSLITGIPTGPKVDVPLTPDLGFLLENQQVAGTNKGTVWVEVVEGNLLFVSMEELVFHGESADSEDAHHSMVIKLDDLVEMARDDEASRRFLFPVTADTWIEGCTPGPEPAKLMIHHTTDVVQDPTFWQGLSLFHKVLCQCEFINKRLELVDEDLRLNLKEQKAREAREAALREIADVLKRPTAVRGPVAGVSADTVYGASQMVGNAQGMEIVNHPEADVKAPFEDRVAAVAKASRCRTRVVALRGEWWQRDQGPILARREEGSEPVALLSKGPRAYEAVDPKTGTRETVDESVAATLAPFGYSFYRPFPDGPISATAMLKFGARGLKRDILMLLAMGIGLGLLGTLTPLFTGKLFDTAIPEAERGLVFQFTLALFVASLASSAFKITQSIAVLRIQGRMDYSLQAAVWDRLLNLPSTFFRDYASGDLGDRAAGINTIRGLISGAGVGSILGSLSSVFYVALMFKYDWRMALLAMFLTFVFIGFTTTANYLQLRQQRDKLRFQGKITGLVLQLISGVGKLRVSGAENHAFRIWAHEFSGQRRLEFKIGRIQNAVEVFNSGFPVIANMAIFFTLISLMRSAQQSGSGGGMSTGEFIAFTAAYGAFQTAMMSLSEASLNMLRIVPIYERLKPIVTTAPEIDESKAYPGRLRGGIEISHVSFRYAEDAPMIFTDISLSIQPGEFVAFVGGSGCGKSTLMRLMLGFETPEKGSIYYDGQDVANLDVRELRQQIGVVLQNSQLLPAEIYRNIIGTSSLTIEDAWEAARLAGLGDDIEEMPMGMHTYVSEGGGGLSGGQRQRLIIARALARKPRILFFDEATSALDNRSQATVTESMERLQATRIVIAHRLSTIINADRICYLEGGKIAESGTYDELMKLDGLFATLAKRQMA